MTQREESDILRDAMRQVIAIMDTTEDSAAIRQVIAEAGVMPGVHVGDPPKSFADDPVKTTRYVLGQWADGIDRETPFLNTFRNMTIAWQDEGRLLA